MKMEETRKKKKINADLIIRELPPSSYEVIRLPMITNKSPTIKSLRDQQQGEKRQRVTSPVTSQAEDFRSKLEAKYPSFTKTLVKSHVSGCFWMGLPQPFCRKHLPSTDTEVLLENEYGKSYKTNYLAKRFALSGGWRGFSEAEKLSEGDALVFQLVTSTKFKVYKLRKIGVNGVDDASAMLNSDMKPSGTDAATLEQISETRRAFSPVTVSQPQNDDHIGLLSEEDEATQVENIGKNTGESNSSDCEHLLFHPVGNSDCGIPAFEDFITLVLKKDFKLPYYIKWSYYQLCCSQNSLLHVDLLEGTNPSLVAGCIIETVNIANAIKSCQLPTFDRDFVLWDQKLKFLDALGMNVRFMSTHLRRLERIACNQEAAKNKQKYMDLCSEHADSENMIQRLRDKLEELIRVSEERVHDIKNLKFEIEKHERRFQEQVSAPW